jgi:hypothetical protein
MSVGSRPSSTPSIGERWLGEDETEWGSTSGFANGVAGIANKSLRSP